VGDRPLLAGDVARLSRHEGKPGPSFRRNGKELAIRRRHVGGRTASMSTRTAMPGWPIGRRRADDQKNFRAKRRRQRRHKFSPKGALMTLGKPGCAAIRRRLTEPTVVLTDPGNGDVYVAESHTNVEDPNLVGRISVFDKSGKFLRTIGKTGTGPGEFRTPHGLAFDSQGRLVVADRHNHRVQVLTKDGKFVAEYPEFSRGSGLAIDKNDTIYVADSESTARVHPGWLRGIRIGNEDGKVTMFVPLSHKTDMPDGAMGEGLRSARPAISTPRGSRSRGVTKYVKQ
jgi:hypothetical protein